AGAGLVGSAAGHQGGGDDTGDVLKGGLAVEVAGHHLGGAGLAPATDAIGLDAVGAVREILNHQGVLDGTAIALVDVDGIVEDIDTDVIGDIDGADEELDARVVGDVAFQVAASATRTDGAEADVVEYVVLCVLGAGVLDLHVFEHAGIVGVVVAAVAGLGLA